MQQSHTMILESSMDSVISFFKTLFSYRLPVHYLFLFLTFTLLFISLFISVAPNSICNKLIWLRNFYIIACIIINIDLIYSKIVSKHAIYPIESDVPLYLSVFIFFMVSFVTAKFYFIMPELVAGPIVPILGATIFIVLYLGVYFKECHPGSNFISIVNFGSQLSVFVFIYLVYTLFNDVRIKYNIIKGELEYSMVKCKAFINIHKGHLDKLQRNFSDAIFKTFFSEDFYSTKKNKLKEMQVELTAFFTSFNSNLEETQAFITKYEDNESIYSLFTLLLVKSENQSIFEVIESFKKSITQLESKINDSKSTINDLKNKIHLALDLDIQVRSEYILKRANVYNNQKDNLGFILNTPTKKEDKKQSSKIPSIQEENEDLTESEGEIAKNTMFWIGGKKTNNTRDGSDPYLCDEANTTGGQNTENNNPENQEKMPRNLSYDSQLKLGSKINFQKLNLSSECKDLFEIEDKIQHKIKQVGISRAKFASRAQDLKTSKELCEDFEDLNRLFTQYLEVVSLYSELEEQLKNGRSKLAKIRNIVIHS